MEKSTQISTMIEYQKKTLDVFAYSNFFRKGNNYDQVFLES